METETEGSGLYLYCIAEGDKNTDFGNIGIMDNEVYSLPYRNISVIVQNCDGKPYETKDNETAKSWILTHQRIIDLAWKEYGTILPFGFDTIIKGDNNFQESLKQWLEKEYDKILAKIEKVRGKKEFGIQIFWTPEAEQKAPSKNEEIKRLEKEMEGKPKGVAYFYKQKIGRLLKNSAEKESDRYFRDFYNLIKGLSFDIKADKIGNRSMVASMACLVEENNIGLLGKELERINNMKGFSVRFTGPWPPYSFV